MRSKMLEHCLLGQRTIESLSAMKSSKLLVRLTEKVPTLLLSSSKRGLAATSRRPSSPSSFLSVFFSVASVTLSLSPSILSFFVSPSLFASSLPLSSTGEPKSISAAFTSSSAIGTSHVAAGHSSPPSSPRSCMAMRRKSKPHCTHTWWPQVSSVYTLSCSLLQRSQMFWVVTLGSEGWEAACCSACSCFCCLASLASFSLRSFSR
mmetsp:Transcript_6160/g.24852  ORF Transcript_6160/g.24852 Transcript_6160/m.24852 type:complete len:206 (-) Transcript_6160:111-728(-)